MTQVIDKTNDIYKQAEEYIKNGKDFKAEGLSEYQNGKFNGYIDGRTEQKEQDKELIEELLESLKTVTKIPMYRREFGNGSIDLEAQHAIAKAENYLKQ